MQIEKEIVSIDPVGLYASEVYVNYLHAMDFYLFVSRRFVAVVYPYS